LFSVAFAPPLIPKEKTKENDQKGRKKRKKESPFFRAKEQLCQGF